MRTVSSGFVESGSANTLLSICRYRTYWQSELNVVLPVKPTSASDFTTYCSSASSYAATRNVTTPEDSLVANSSALEPSLRKNVSNEPTMRALKFVVIQFPSGKTERSAGRTARAPSRVTQQ